MRHEPPPGGGDPWYDAHKHLLDLQRKVEHRIKVLQLTAGFNSALLFAQMVLAIMIAVLTMARIVAVWMHP